MVKPIKGTILDFRLKPVYSNSWRNGSRSHQLKTIKEVIDATIGQGGLYPSPYHHDNRKSRTLPLPKPRRKPRVALHHDELELNYYKNLFNGRVDPPRLR